MEANLMLASLLVAGSLAAGAAPPLGVAGMVPSDADAVVQFRGPMHRATGPGAELLRSCAEQVLERLGACERWRQAALAASMAPDALLDRVAGRDASLVLRRSEQGPSWVLALEMPGGDACDLLRGMKARMAGRGRFELPQLGLAGAWHREWLLVSDRPENPLLQDMLGMADDAPEASMRSVLPEDLQLDPDAAVTVALRHRGEGAGHSVWAFTPTRAGVAVQMEGVAADPILEPLVDGAEPMTILEAMPEETVACWMQRRSVDPLPQAWRRALPGRRVDAELLATLGERMVVVVGPDDPEGVPQVAVAVQLLDAEAGTHAQDEMLDRVARVLARERGETVQPRRRDGVPLEAPRWIEGPGVAAAAWDGWPLPASAELHARTVVTGRGGWRLYASGRAWLDRVTGSLEEHPLVEGGHARPAGWDRHGFVHGHAVAPWLGAAASAREGAGGCAEGMRVLERMVARCGLAEWRMRSPSPGRIQARAHVVPSSLPSAQTPPSMASRP
jgi:hypothetical protein